MARSPTHNGGMTLRELDIGDSDLSLDPAGLLDDPDAQEREAEEVVPGLEDLLHPDSAAGDAPDAAPGTGTQDADGPSAALRSPESHERTGRDRR